MIPKDIFDAAESFGCLIMAVIVALLTWAIYATYRWIIG